MRLAFRRGAFGRLPLQKCALTWAEERPHLCPLTVCSQSSYLTSTVQPRPSAALERAPAPPCSPACRVAATLGWVALLRQLQPAGRSDYLLARVRLPAAAVRDAQRMAEVGAGRAA